GKVHLHAASIKLLLGVGLRATALSGGRQRADIGTARLDRLERRDCSLRPRPRGLPLDTCLSTCIEARSSSSRARCPLEVQRERVSKASEMQVVGEGESVLSKDKYT